MLLSLFPLLPGTLPTEDGQPDTPVDVQALVKRAQHGDREAVSQLYRHHVQTIYRYVASRLPTPADAEDVTGDVFVKMVEGLASYRWTGAPFEAWLYRIAASQVAAYYRHNKKAADELDESVPDEHSTAHGEEDAVDELRAALRQLTEEQQTVLILRFVERRSHEDVARLVGKSVTAVKSMQHRALTQLTELLGGSSKVRHYLRADHD